MDGTTTDRHSMVTRFQQASGFQCFFLTTGVGSIGLNLFNASTVFILEPSWNPQDDNQAIYRCFRLGQRQPVNVYRFVSSFPEGCDAVHIEDYIYKLQLLKSALATRIVDEGSVETIIGRDELIRLTSTNRIFTPLPKLQSPLDNGPLLQLYSQISKVGIPSFNILDHDELCNTPMVEPPISIQSQIEYAILMSYGPRTIITTRLALEYSVASYKDDDACFFPEPSTDELRPPYPLIPKSYTSGILTFDVVRPIAPRHFVEYQFKTATSTLRTIPTITYFGDSPNMAELQRLQRCRVTLVSFSPSLDDIYVFRARYCSCLSTNVSAWSDWSKGTTLLRIA